jgi:phosphatidylserine decarboxylase
MSQIELRSMLDSLGSTLTNSTMASFFTRFGKNPDEGEISIDQAVQCLEAELGRPDSEKKHIDVDESQDTSMSVTPLFLASGPKGEKIDLDSLDFSGPPHVSAGTNGALPQATEGTQRPLVEVAASIDGTVSSSDAEESFSGSASSSVEKKKSRFGVGRIGKAKKEASGDSSPIADSVERVINVKNCPLCHRARLNDKGEMDIITHLAICASQDWHQVDKIMVGNFVTASQAQRKWYTKVIGKLSAGNYRLGAVSNCHFFRFAITEFFSEFRKHYRAKSPYRTTGGRKNAGLRSTWNSLIVQRGIRAHGRGTRYAFSFSFFTL